MALEVIYGPMFSGKTEELLRRLTVAERAGLAVVALKPSIDTRGGADIVSHSGTRRAALLIDRDRAVDVAADVVAVDEANFLGAAAVDSLLGLRARVIVAGLDLDFRRQPFAEMPRLIDAAAEAVRLTARCGSCGGPAEYTQRYFDGRPAPLDDATIRVGGEELYEPRCGRCYELERSVRRDA